MWNDLEIFIPPKNPERCVLCQEREVDCVKTGNPLYDKTCGVCIDKQAKLDGLDPMKIYRTLEFDLVALGAFATVLSKRHCGKESS